MINKILEFSRRQRAFVLALAAALMLAGCGHKEGDGHDHDKGKAQGMGHEEEPPSGASFKAGKGVTLTDETRKLLKIETVEVSEQKLPHEVRFTAQVFGEVHTVGASATTHTECTVRASGLLSPGLAASLALGQPVTLTPKRGESLDGSIQEVHPESALGEAELLLAITNAGARLQSGDFLAAMATVPRAEAVMVVPRSAVLRTAGGTFVYAVNGESFYRTAVKVGGESGGLVEITDGLLAGDSVVTTPVETLWLIELRALKGGGHSH